MQGKVIGFEEHYKLSRHSSGKSEQSRRIGL